ncbi:head GIN domain-containing protein [Lutimonas vermicola]|uniref:Head GIN domain-containing protein n=1 Tax=Lutimonas vermicola TaxID=414288 RepID=A0ABU9KY77_9FLAO
MKNSILKSTVLLLILTLAFGTSYAQKVKGNGKIINKTRTVGSFDGVGVSGSFDVFLVAGEEGKLDISVEENLEPYLITEVKDGTLNIKWKKGTNIRTSAKTTVTVHFKNINSLAMAGSGDIIGKDKIKGNSLNVALAGSGDIDVEMDVQQLKTAISGSGDIEFSGSATEFEAAVSGSGDVDAYDLKTEKAALKISGSGSIGVHVEKEIVARVSGSGDIKYKGQPRIEDIKVSGSGNISSY